MTRVSGPTGFIRIPPEARFWEKVDRSAGDDGCWLWTGPMRTHGYGYTTDYWKKILVHRFVYEMVTGPIPEGMNVCHSCDVRNCVNPKHLWVGTHTDNMRDMMAKGRANRRGPTNPKRGVDSPSAKLTETQVREIRERYAAADTTWGRRRLGVGLDTLASQYGVSRTLVYNIVTRKAWAHID